MDLTQRHRVCELVQQLTQAGRAVPEPLLLDELKLLCRGSDAALRAAFAQLMDVLATKHAQVRLTAVQLIHELFMRSHLFRMLLTSDFKRLMELAVGLDDADAPLPPPERHASTLRETALACIHKWHGKYGSRFPQLAIAYKTLSIKRQVDFVHMQARTRAEEQRHSQEIERRRKQHEDQLKGVASEQEEYMPHIRDALKQVSACMELVVPRMHSDEQVPAGLSSDSGPDPVHERETLLQDLGLNTREYELTVELRADHRVVVTENHHNRDLLRTFKEQHLLLRRQYLARVNGWLKTLQKCQVQGAEEAVRSLLELKNKITDICARAAALVVGDEFADNSSSDDDVLLTDVMEFAEKEGYEAEAPVELSAPPQKSLQEQKQIYLSRLPSVGKHRRCRKYPEPVEDTEAATAASPVVTEAIPGIPVLPYGLDLEYWGRDDEIVPPAGMTSLHRFWRPKDHQEGEGVPAGRLGLTTRCTYYQSTAEPVKHFCNAPLGLCKEDGAPRLCSRQDKYMCPFHGKIIPRGPDGVPVDPAMLKASPVATVVEPKKRKREAANSGLEDLKKQKDTAQSRLLRKTKNTHIGMDPALARLRQEKFQGTWISP